MFFAHSETDRGKPTLKDTERFRNGFRDHDHMMKALYAMKALYVMS